MLFAETYILEFTQLLDKSHYKNAKKIFSRYNMIVVDGEYNEIKEMYPDAIGIYKDKKLRAVYAPNDEYFSYQWNLLTDHYNLSLILDRGITGSKGIIIGILDTGIAFEDYAMPASEVDKVYSSTGDYHKYNDFENINFVQGYDFISNDDHPNDMNGHGTSCCAIIASSINNSIDLSGIIYDASIMPLRVLDENGEGSMVDIVAGIEYGIDNGCRVLNLSLAGTPGDSIGWHPLHIAIIDAVNNNVAVICATGNEGVNELSYPSAFPEAIAVGAVDYYKERAPYSQYGDNLDFMAPGGLVYQDINGTNDGGIIVPSFDYVGEDINVAAFNLFYGEGTSFAAPHLTAIVGLLYSIGYNNINEINNILIENCIDLGNSGFDDEYGWGYPLPDYIFSLPVSVKIIDYDHVQNSVDVFMRPLKSGVIVDSTTINWKDHTEKTNLNNTDNIYYTTIQGKNTGIYILNIYVNDNGDNDSMSREIAMKSPLDTTSYIFNGKTKIGFSGNSSGMVTLISDRSMHIDMDNKSPVNIEILVEKNPSSYSVIHNNIEIDINRYSDKISFTADKSGYYYIKYNASKYYPIYSTTSNKRTIFLTSNVLKREYGEYSIYDYTGRLVKRINGKIIDFSSVKAGIYFIKGKSSIWKIIKSF